MLHGECLEKCKRRIKKCFFCFVPPAEKFIQPSILVREMLGGGKYQVFLSKAVPSDSFSVCSCFIRVTARGFSANCQHGKESFITLLSLKSASGFLDLFQISPSTYVASWQISEMINIWSHRPSFSAFQHIKISHFLKRFIFPPRKCCVWFLMFPTASCPCQDSPLLSHLDESGDLHPKRNHRMLCW